MKYFTTSVSEAPLTPAYLRELAKSVELPATLTLDELKPQLKALGVDVDTLVPVLTPSLSSSELSTFLQIAAKPIQMRYVLSFSGRAAVEPTTGAEVQVAVTEAIGVHPELPDLPALQAILANHSNLPMAGTAAKALETLSTAPATKLFEYRYDQTPASVADIAGQVKSNRNQVILVKRYVPFGLLGAALVAFAASGLVLWRRRPVQPVDVRISPPAIEQIPEREHVTTS